MEKLSVTIALCENTNAKHQMPFLHKDLLCNRDTYGEVRHHGMNGDT